MNKQFTPQEVCRHFGVTYRQLWYWGHTKFLEPSCKVRKKYRRYNFNDVLIIHIVQELRTQHGQSVQRLRRLIRFLRNKISMLGPDLDRATFVILLEPNALVDRVLTFYGTPDVSNEETWRGINFSVKEIRGKIEKAFSVQPDFVQP